MNKIKNWIKGHPIVFDRLRCIRRMMELKKEPVYAFFDSLSREKNRSLNFIQIGANDGLRNDPIREFIFRDNWRGTLVEPLPNAFELLKKNYANIDNLQFINVAISTKNETLDFWTFKESYLLRLGIEERLNYIRKSSFDKGHVMKFLSEDQIEAQILQRIAVPCLNINDLILKNHPSGKLDLLVIDAEGYEFEIIKSISFQITKPEVIFYESHHLGENKRHLEDLLRAVGYEVHDISGDSVARVSDNITTARP